MKMKKKKKKKCIKNNIYEKIIKLNRGYNWIRKKLYLPKVLVLSKQDYDYEKEKWEEEEIERACIQYMDDEQYEHNIFYCLLVENSNNKTIKEIITNSTINKTLSLYGDKKNLYWNIKNLVILKKGKKIKIWV